jgi:hypothetical protein
MERSDIRGSNVLTLSRTSLADALQITAGPSRISLTLNPGYVLPLIG